MIRTIVLCALVSAITVGCDWKVSRTATAIGAKPKPTHRHSHEPDAYAGSATKPKIDVPTGYVAAVERLRECINTFKDAIAAGANSKANRPLDEAEIVTEEIMLIAHDSRVPKGAWQEVHAAQRSLPHLSGKATCGH